MDKYISGHGEHKIKSQMGKKLEENEEEQVVAQKEILGDVIVGVQGEHDQSQTHPWICKCRGSDSGRRSDLGDPRRGSQGGDLRRRGQCWGDLERRFSKGDQRRCSYLHHSRLLQVSDYSFERVIRLILIFRNAFREGSPNQPKLAVKNVRGFKLKMDIKKLNFNDQILLINSSLVGDKAKDNNSFTQRLLRWDV